MLRGARHLKNIIKRLIPKKIKQKIKNSIYENYSITSAKQSVFYDTSRFNGKVIVVTGANGAIGSALCSRFLSEGAIVVACGRSIEKLNYTLNRITTNIDNRINGSYLSIKMDVTNDEEIALTLEKVIDLYGKIDILINNAGGYAKDDNCTLVDKDISTIDSVLNTNLRGTIICSKEASKYMIINMRGRIINLASVMGMCGKAGMLDYATSKSGILGFTKSLAMELGHLGITVNCVSPGMVNMIPFDSELPIKITNKNYLRRFGYTNEVASLIAFLASDEANYITGQNFVIDGGRSLGLHGDE